MHDKNGKFSIIMKGENFKVLDDTYTITSDIMKRNFTRQIALHAEEFTSDCGFNILKGHAVGCQMRETWKYNLCAKEFNWASCRVVRPSKKIMGTNLVGNNLKSILG